MKKRSPLFYVIITILLWSTVPAIAKLTLKTINSLQLLLFVTLFAVIGLFLMLLFQKKLYLLKKYSLKDHKHLIYLGLFSMFLTTFLFYSAIAKATAIEASIINYTWPIWIVILSIFILREKASTKTFLGVILGFLGIVLVITKGNFQQLELTSLYGGLLALGGAFSWGIFSVLSKKHKFEPFSSMFYCSVYGFIFALITVLLTKAFIVPSTFDILGAAYIGIFATALAFVLWLKSLEKGKIHLIANLAYLTPFLSLIFIYFLVGEKIFISQILGLIVIIAGIFIQAKK